MSREAAGKKKLKFRLLPTGGGDYYSVGAANAGTVARGVGGGLAARAAAARPPGVKIQSRAVVVVVVVVVVVAVTFRNRTFGVRVFTVDCAGRPKNQADVE